MTPCVPWTGYVDPHGYGRLGTNKRAHRWAYERAYGPIPPGMVLDHSCHDPAVCAGGSSCPHRRCVEPTHLVPTPRAENVSSARRSDGFAARGVCRSGRHDVTDPAALYVRPSGERECRACRREARR